MKRLIEILVFGAKPFFATMAFTAAGALIATFLISRFRLTLTLWVVLFVASLTAVMGSGIRLHFVRKQKTEGFTLPGEIPPEGKREILPLVTIIVAMFVVLGLLNVMIHSTVTSSLQL